MDEKTALTDKLTEKLIQICLQKGLTKEDILVVVIFNAYDSKVVKRFKTLEESLRLAIFIAEQSNTKEEIVARIEVIMAHKVLFCAPYIKELRPTLLDIFKNKD